MDAPAAKAARHMRSTAVRLATGCGVAVKCQWGGVYGEFGDDYLEFVEEKELAKHEDNVTFVKCRLRWFA